jgi:hypothetical protein
MPQMAVEFKINLPFGLGDVTFKPNDIEKKAAWELYVELVTRIATQEIAANEALDREALNSLYSLFTSTRQVLRAAGPSAGLVQGTVGGVAVDVLNKGLRPFLTKWHPSLKSWEAVGKLDDNWPERQQFRSELAAVGRNLSRYAEALAIIAGVGNQI